MSAASEKTARPGVRRVVGAIIRQFWWVLVIAALWAWFTFDREQPIASFAAKLSGAAFLLMYFAGQFLRVQKQLSDGDAQQRADTEFAMLHQEIREIEDKVSRGEDLLRLALRARGASDPLDLVAALETMVNRAIRLPDTGDDIDAISLWWPQADRRTWEVLASDGVSDTTRERFRQQMLDEPESGGGVVANLAAPRESTTGDLGDVFIASDARAHDWFAPDPYRRRESIGMAAVLLRNQRLEPIGALCITSGVAGAIPRASDAEARQRLQETLLVWQIAFTLPLERLLELRDE